MFKVLLVCCVLATAAVALASPAAKPGVLAYTAAAPVAYSAPYAYAAYSTPYAYSAYSAYSAPLTYSPYTYAAPYSYYYR